MPTTIVFVGGDKITVNAELNEMADMLSRARPERVERLHGSGPRQRAARMLKRFGGSEKNRRLGAAGGLGGGAAPLTTPVSVGPSLTPRPAEARSLRR